MGLTAICMTVRIGGGWWWGADLAFVGSALVLVLVLTLTLVSFAVTCLPGVARRQLTCFLLRQRKVSKRKATRLSGSLRFASGDLRCPEQAGVELELACGSDNRSPFSRLSGSSQAQTGRGCGGGEEAETEIGAGND